MPAWRRSGSPRRAAGSGRLPKHTFGGLRRRRAMPVRRLDGRALRYVARTLETRSAREVAGDLGISQSWAYELRAHCRRTGAPPEPRPMGRPRRDVTDDEVTEVLAEHSDRPAGVVRVAEGLRGNNSKITYWSVYRIMLAEGLVTRSRAKSRRRKWVRFERAHSNAMWHVDWHIMKYGPLRGAHLVVFLDDASRCVTGFGVFAAATSANTVMVLRKAIKTFGAPAQVLSDHGTQFTATRRGTPTRSWTPTLFEQELLDRDMAHLMARVRHPQTNGKVERFFQTLEAEIGHFGGVPEFIAYYNERRLHFALDIKGGETPLLAFRRRRADGRARAENPRWMEVDSND